MAPSPLPPCPLPALPSPLDLADLVRVTPDGILFTADGFRALGRQLVDRDAWIREAYLCLAEHALVDASK